MSTVEPAGADGVAAVGGLGRTTRRRRTVKLSEMIAREIVHDIAARKLPPDTMLSSEAVMAAQYGIGRASLREALRILEVQGILRIKPGPGGGPVVVGANTEHFAQMATLYFHLGGATFRDLIEARLVIEPVMARLAAERLERGDVDRLLAHVRVDVDPGNDQHYLEQASGFHAALCTMSGNPVLDFVGRAIKDIFTERIHGQLFPTDARSRVQDAHEEVAAAIADGRAAAAEHLMRAHMEEFVEYSAQRHPGMMDEIVDWSHSI